MRRTSLPVRLLRQRLLLLLDALPAAVSGDVTSVHQARVASRRVREVLPVLAEAAGSDVLDRSGRQVRRITRVLGPIREMDVALGHLEMIGPRAGVSPRALARVRKHLTDTRLARRRTMLDVITPATLVRLRARLHDPPPHPHPHSHTPANPDATRRSAGRRAARRAIRLRAAIRQAGSLYDFERLHAVRIAAKKLRYALEVERELTRSRAMARINRLKGLQDALGEVHDFEVLLAHVREVQALSAGADRRLSAELEALVRTLEDQCRAGHGGFLRQRPAILELCRRIVEAARDGRPTFMS